LLELETQLIIARNLEYLAADHCEKLMSSSAELSKILYGLIEAVKKRKAAGAGV